MYTKMQAVVAIVTGGASGIGKAVVERIVRHGGKVAILDQSLLGQQLAEKLGANTIFCKVDVTSEVDVNEALTLVKQRFGCINAVINCAGIAMLHLPYDFARDRAHPLEIYQQVMNVNALGTFNVTRLAAGVMAANSPDENQQRGVIINTASVWARDAPSYAVAYAASKSAIRGMTIPFARGFAGQGIRVVSISPGFTDTPMTANVRNDSMKYEETLECVLAPVRPAKTDEIAHLVQSIIENPYINGVDMEISAGWHFFKKKDESIYWSSN